MLFYQLIKNIEDKCYQSTLLIHVKDLVKIEEMIGFRYCCHKSYRLAAGSSFHRYKKINTETKKACEYIEDIGVLKWFDKKQYAERQFGFLCFSKHTIKEFNIYFI